LRKWSGNEEEPGPKDHRKSLLTLAFIVPSAEFITVFKIESE